MPDKHIRGQSGLHAGRRSNHAGVNDAGAISAAGEEATIVGVTSVMRPDDYVIGTYRTHGHAIARGTDPKNVMAELFGRVDGTSRGRGGFRRGDRPGRGAGELHEA